MSAHSIGLDHAPYAKVLSHQRFLAIRTLRLARKEASIESPVHWYPTNQKFEASCV